MSGKGSFPEDKIFAASATTTRRKSTVALPSPPRMLCSKSRAALDGNFLTDYFTASDIWCSRRGCMVVLVASMQQRSAATAATTSVPTYVTRLRFFFFSAPNQLVLRYLLVGPATMWLGGK